MKELELYDIYGTWHVPFWQTTLFLNTLFATGVLLAVGVCWYVYKRYKRKKTFPLPQHILAQLMGVRASFINTTQDAQKAYEIMTAALKTYFQYYYEKPFTVLSDNELQNAIAVNHFPEEYKEAIKKLLEDGVHVKFARENALQQQVSEHAQLSIDIINHLEKTRKSS